MSDLAQPFNLAHATVQYISHMHKVGLLVLLIYFDFVESTLLRDSSMCAISLIASSLNNLGKTFILALLAIA